MNTKNHKIIKGRHVAFDSKPSKELESAISEMIDIAKEKIKTYKVLVGDPFGGYATVKSGLSLSDAKQLESEVNAECDYFTTTSIEPD